MNKRQERSRYANVESRSAAFQSDAWIDHEVAACDFKDVRLGSRFRRLLEQFSENVGGSIPWACQDWANTKAAYRFLSNGRVSESEILAGHFQATRSRLPGDDRPVLILHDTTEFSYHRKDPDSVGILHPSPVRTDRDGNP